MPIVILFTYLHNVALYALKLDNAMAAFNAMHCSHICAMSNVAFYTFKLDDARVAFNAMHCSHICAISNVDFEAQEVYSLPPPVIISPHTARQY